MQSLRISPYTTSERIIISNACNPNSLGSCVGYKLLSLLNQYSSRSQMMIDKKTRRRFIIMMASHCTLDSLIGPRREPIKSRRPYQDDDAGIELIRHEAIFSDESGLSASRRNIYYWQIMRDSCLQPSNSFLLVLTVIWTCLS